MGGHRRAGGQHAGDLRVGGFGGGCGRLPGKREDHAAWRCAAREGIGLWDGTERNSFLLPCGVGGQGGASQPPTKLNELGRQQSGSDKKNSREFFHLLFHSTPATSEGSAPVSEGEVSNQATSLLLASQWAAHTHAKLERINKIAMHMAPTAGQQPGGKVTVSQLVTLAGWLPKPEHEEQLLLHHCLYPVYSAA